MDIDSLIKVVSGSLSSLAHTKGDGKGKDGKSHNKMTPKFDGKCDNCGKYGHRKRDCWSKGSSGGKGTSTSRTTSTSPSKEKFTGKCNHCGKSGRKKADCWLLNASGKGKGTKGNSKGKSKNANALEGQSEPAHEPASASGLELCTLTVASDSPEQEEPDGDDGQGEPPGEDEVGGDHEGAEEEERAEQDELVEEEHVARSSRTRTSRSRSRRTRSLPRGFREDASRSRTTSPQTRAQRELRTTETIEQFDFEVDWQSEAPASEQWSQVTAEHIAQSEEAEEEMEEILEEPCGDEEQWSPSLASVARDEPKWVCCNLDTGASLTVFPKKLFQDNSPVSMRLKTASGEIVQGYGRATLRGSDVTGMNRKLNGNVADVHKVLISASQMHGKGYTTWLHAGGGEIIPKNHPVNAAMEKAYNEAIARHGKEGIIPVTEEGGVYNC